MAAGGFGLGAAQIGGEPARAMTLQKLDWFEGRNGSLLGFDRETGLLAFAIYPGRHVTPQQNAWLRLGLAIFKAPKYRERGRHRDAT